MTPEKIEEIKNGLMYCNGTEEWHRHPLFKRFLFTDGIKFLADNAKCYWLIEYIFSHQTSKRLNNSTYDFFVWHMKKTESGGMRFRVEDGNDNTIAEYSIPYTDFPFDEFTVWFKDNVLLLPSEY